MNVNCTLDRPRPVFFPSDEGAVIAIDAGSGRADGAIPRHPIPWMSPT